MTVSQQIHGRTTPVSLGLVAAVGLATALVATYWDDSWHTDRGRDEFFIPPHLLLYGGVSAASLAIAAWALMTWRAAGWGASGIRMALHDPAVRLAGIGGGVTLASAPLDSWWHVTFGRDAVLWSPPHLTAVVGILALVVGLAAGLRDADGPGAGTARLFAGAGIIGALQMLVLEYDSDVPQFSSLWFLPVAAWALCLAVALLNDLLPGRWKPSQAALVYTGMRVATLILLSILGFSLTVVPPVFPLLLVVGALANLTLAGRLVILGGLAPLAWWPALELQSTVTTTVSLSQVPAAVFMGAAGGALIAVVHGDVHFEGRHMLNATRVAIVLGVVTVAVGGSVGRAWGHDPGQGAEVEAVRLTVSRTSDAATLRMVMPSQCERFDPTGVLARRAGQTINGALRLAPAGDDGCMASGALHGLSGGRWFIYAQLRRGDTDVEAWLPVDRDSTTTSTRPLYQTPSAGRSSFAQFGVGGALVLIILGLFVTTLRLSRRVARPTRRT